MSRLLKPAFAAALLALVAVAVWFASRESSRTAAAPAPVALAAAAPTSPELPSDEPPTLFPRNPLARPGGSPVPPMERLPAARTPVIDEVVVDKRSVCLNEDVRVSVRAHVPGGLDEAFLRYRIADQEGPVVTLRRLTQTSSGPLAERGGYSVTVHGRDGTFATAPLPDIEVRDCRLPDEFELVHYREPGTEGQVRLVASPIGHNPDIEAVRKTGADSQPPFEPVRYVWTFGDGTTEETTEHTVVHDFGARPQTGEYSYFEVTCEAYDAQGQKLTARRTLELENPAFAEFVREGRVRLLAQPQPALTREDGQVTVPVRLWHGWDSAITVQSVKVRRHRARDWAEADERHPPARPADEELFSALALGTSSLPPSGLLVPVHFDAERDADIAAKEFLLEGRTPEGWPVRGRFVASRPEVDPLVRRMLVDSEWRARVLRARSHLGRVDVGEDEVKELEAQGLFADLPRAFEGLPPPGFAPPPRLASRED